MAGESEREADQGPAEHFGGCDPHAPWSRAACETVGLRGSDREKR
jgi:hypothetical protein